MPLSDLGRSQARCLAKRLVREQARIGVPPWQALFSSNLIRARQTAEVAADALGLEITISRLLRERDLGPWEGLTFDELMAKYPGEARDWKADPGKSPVPGIETAESVVNRMIQFCDEALKQYSCGRILAVSHGAAIGRLVRTISRLPSSEVIKLDNAGITTVNWDGLEGRVDSVNDCSHLDSAWQEMI